MNIFYLDINPTLAAQYQCDKHVVKMIVETAQLMSTAHHILDGSSADPGLYKSTHKNHPSAIWVRESNNNYNWLLCHLMALLHEYHHRYGKRHKTGDLLPILMRPPKNIPITYFKNPPQCMPDEFKTENTVEAYRNYYRTGKAHLLAYTKRERPDWL